MRTTDLSKTLDHTVLAPETTRDDVVQACARAHDVHLASVCVAPRHVPEAVASLRGSDVKTCVILDDAGGTALRRQIAIVERAVCQGVDEVDVALNIAALRSGAFGVARQELWRLVYAVRTRAANDARGTVAVKAIVGVPLLDEALVRMACKIVSDVGADFAVAWTGAQTPMIAGDVELMRDALPETIGVTAAGGVCGLAHLQEMVSAGATRIGTSDAVEVLEQVRATTIGSIP
jgi:deoxyribose-phosphate aldolase